MKTSALQKTIPRESKDKPQNWVKIFAKDRSDKGHLFKIYKEFLKPNSKKTNNPIKNSVKDLSRDHQRRYTDGKQEYEKMLHIIYHQGKAN